MKLTIKKLEEKYASNEIKITKQIIKLACNEFPQRYYAAGTKHSDVKIISPTLILLDEELQNKYKTLGG